MTTPIDHPGALRGGPTWPALGASPHLTSASPATHPPSGCPISPRYRPQTQGIFLCLSAFQPPDGSVQQEKKALLPAP